MIEGLIFSYHYRRIIIINVNMYKEFTKSIMAKYLENKTNKEETLFILEHLIPSEKDRQILNLASAGLRCMYPENLQNKLRK